MNNKAAKRVDGVYRNIKLLPLLACLSVIFVPIGIFILPITFLCSSFRSNLLRDYDSGKITVEEHDRISQKPGELTTEQKLQFLKHGRTTIWVPYTIGTMWWLFIGFLAIAALTQ